MKAQRTRLMPSQALFGSVEQLLQEGYDADFTVTGNSMWPLLSHKRDRVTICSTEKMRPKKGDVVLYCPQPGKYLLHRIHRMETDRFVAAGDGNCFVDGTFPVSNIVGVVVQLHRKGKTLRAHSPMLRFWGWVWIGLYPVRGGLLKLLRKIAGRKPGGGQGDR